MSSQPAQSFDVNHLKDVIAVLTKAAQVEELQEQKKKEIAPGNVAPSALNPQMKREKFVKEVVETSLFKMLQVEFFKIVPKMGQEILTTCQDAYNNQQLTNEQRDELAKIGQKLSSEIPFRMLSGSMDVKEGFKEFVGALRMTQNFFTANPALAMDLGSKVLSIFKSLATFISSTREVVEEAPVPKPIKEGFQERLNLVDAQSKEVDNVVQSAIREPLPAPVVDMAKLLINSPVVQELQKNLLTAVFPIGGTILNVGFSLYNSGILRDKQRNELAEIGKNIMDLPVKLLTGEIDLQGMLTGLTDGLKSLGNFFVSNPDIAVRAGATILPSLLPLGGFLKQAVSFVAQSDIAQDVIGQGISKGIGLLSHQVLGVENVLEKSANQVLAAPKQ